MEYRQLGRSGLRVSEIALGTMTFGGRGSFAAVGATEVEDARRLIDLAYDAGVNLIDTADSYSGGRSEEIVGDAVARRREQFVIATKARFYRDGGPNDGGLSRSYLIRACEASLRRLKTDYIDLYQVHERDGVTPIEETLDALDTLVHAGKVRYIGCSNHSAWHVMEAQWAAERRALIPYTSQQIYYSLLDREAEYELIPMSIDHGLGVLVWSPLAGGLLSGKYRRGEDPPAGSRHAGHWQEPPVYDWERLYEIVEVLREVAGAHGRPPAQVALAFLLGRPGVTSVIVGARNELQLLENLASVTCELDTDERERLDGVSRPPLVYPYWHQARTVTDRLSPGDLSLLGQYQL